MKSTTHIQNGNTRVNFDNNVDTVRMDNSSTVSGGVAAAGNQSSTSLINQTKAISFNQPEQSVWQNASNGFVNGNNNNNKSALDQTKPYAKKFSGNGLDGDFDDDEKTNSFGLTRRVDGLSTLKNATSNELYIDEKNISLHLNNPFVTHFAVSSTSLSSSSASGTVAAATVSSFEQTMVNRNIDRQFYNSSGASSVTNSMPQSASTSQLSNVIKSQQLKNYGASGSNEKQNGNNDYGRINDIDNNTLRNRPKRPHSIAGVLSSASLSSSSSSSLSSSSSFAARLSVLNQNKDELTSLITAGVISSRTATTTMTYSNSNSNSAPNNNHPNGSNNGSMKSSMNTMNNVNNGNQNAMAQKVFNQPQNNEYAQQASTHVSYGHFINSPSRLTSNRQPAAQEPFSLYTPPSVTTTTNVTCINNGSNNNPQSIQTRQQPPPIVQRRSHSTPRSVPSTVLLGIATDNANKSTPSTVNNNSGVPAARPRSLDRAR